MCGGIGIPQLAASPAGATSLRNVAAVIGARRSEMKTQADCVDLVSNDSLQKLRLTLLRNREDNSRSCPHPRPEPHMRYSRQVAPATPRRRRMAASQTVPAIVDDFVEDLTR